MGRPPLPLGTNGHIETTTISPGVVRARTWVRDLDGKRRRVERRAKTKPAAIAALKAALANRSLPADPKATISPDTLLRDLTQRWIDSRSEDGTRPQTLRTYQDRLNSLVHTRIGDLRLSEIKTSTIQDLYDTLGPGKAKSASAPLSMALDIAVRCDIYPANPARLAKPPAKAHKQGTVLPADQLIDIRRKLNTWAIGSKVIAHQSLPDFVDLMVATACRTSEVLAFSFDDADLSTTPLRLTVTSTLVPLRGGTIRQEMPKSEAGHRSLYLPLFAEIVVRRRYDNRREGVTANVIFPSSTDGLLASKRIQEAWAAFRTDVGHPGIELRTIRRSIATLIAADAGIEAAASQLGHADSAVTERHYVAPQAAAAPDLTTLLQSLA